MRALVVDESMFGNAHLIADSVGKRNILRAGRCDMTMTEGDEQVARQQAIRQIERRRFWVSAVWFSIGM